ncbi:MAG: hypothetical protein ACYDHW_08525 [Syntrophorhabdaceae bacterium]
MKIQAIHPVILLIAILVPFIPVSADAGPSEIPVQDLWKAMNTVGKAQEQGKKGADMAKQGSDWFDAFKPLNDQDKQADPNYNPPGMPEVPTSCDEAKIAGCKDCYKDAYDKLYKLRMNFEKLRALKISTEDFTKASLSFGDSVSGVHGVAGLGWQAERRKIEASFKNFEKAYRNKHQELADKLKGVLHEIDQCEAKYYDEKDWYNRFGYMYFTFMEDRYKW